MTGVILSVPGKFVEKFPFPRAPKPGEITLFIAGHGTEKNENSRQPIDRQVTLIRAMNLYAGVHAIFLEETPRIPECYRLAQTKNLVVVPFFISDGLHTQEDIRFCWVKRNLPLSSDSPRVSRSGVIRLKKTENWSGIRRPSAVSRIWPT